MELYSLLSKEEIDMIEYYREMYAVAGEEYDGHGRVTKNKATLNYILRFWEQNKQDLFHLLGDKLIYETEIEYHKSSSAMKNEFIDLIIYSKNVYNIRNTEIIDSASTFFRELSECIHTYEADLDVRNILTNSNFIIENKLPKSADGLYSNILKRRLQKGEKITKIYSKIAEIYDIKEFENFRLAHSQILNNKTVKGTLCLSIHPLDFMTMSDNNSGWESCMSWRNYGCYRQGTVEMMNSPKVLVAYIKGKEDFKFDNYFWNNKKWRQLFVITPDIITGIKSYPYLNQDITNICLKKIKELCGEDSYFDNLIQIDYQTGNTGIVGITGEEKVELPEFRFEFETNKMYNDIDNSVENGYVYLGKNILNRTYYINYSGDTECMWCGAESYWDLDCDSLICYDCIEEESDEDSFYCRDCGNRVDNDEGYELDNHGSVGIVTISIE